ncbi:PemK-like, MazF-like toxin of type II toxin-antitoxin system [Corynebacterium coyleae]|nr:MULTISPECIES: type II toxin-antitoxin system PemK/MazF family toxin [Corynebacterium]MDK6492845.1 type II toxin-antitoxin system PemK/MazF family toxin [Corynebacterium coyleae]MDK8241364.1 type II toxin-antitoxin system PemK/MazF family toxin [Corynebacterium coyleae]MDK8823295.1 type II toxin-antitoxin system PemK/MazF family toxin [Corynebacterium coyleae]UBI09763.1 type II toxin-antitoxin system PemK/MazF family toxin [Corynebacterium coyleae]WJY80433.1 PemK-like protein [Corynebacteriu
MAFERFKRKRKPVLDHGFTLFGDRLTSQIQQRRGRAPQVSVRPTDSVCRSIYYAPDMDGTAEPGEVVWVTVPSHPPRQRSILIVGRERHDVLGLLISPEREHENDERWFEIGPGDWESSGQPCWVRLDKTLVVPESDVERRGTTVPPRRFQRVANTLRERFNWS